MTLMYYKWMYLNSLCRESNATYTPKIGCISYTPPFHECYIFTSYLDVTIKRILFIERVTCEIYIQKGYASTIFLAEIYV